MTGWNALDVLAEAIGLVLISLTVLGTVASVAWVALCEFFIWRNRRRVEKKAEQRLGYVRVGGFYHRDDR